MDAFNIPKAVVCGLSMGGYIVLHAIQEYPERFEAIILSDTQCPGDSEVAKEKRKETARQVKQNGLTTFADGFVKSVFCKASLDTKKELVERVRSMILATPPETVVAGLSALAERANRCATLSEIEVPTLIMCGREDVLTPPELSEFMRSKIKHATLRILDGAGHVANLEQPEAFNRHIVEFVEERVNMA